MHRANRRDGDTRSIAFNTENLKSISLVVSSSPNKPAIYKERAHDAPVPKSIRL
jgi:hypothetical protein